MRVNDRGSIVVGWLARLVVLFAVLGVVAFDGVKIVVANVGAADTAAAAAASAAEAYRSSKNVQTAYNTAVSTLSEGTDTVDTSTFSVDATGHVTLTVERRPSTLWMQHIGPLKKWTLVHQTGTGAPPS